MSDDPLKPAEAYSVVLTALGNELMRAFRIHPEHHTSLEKGFLAALPPELPEPKRLKIKQTVANVLREQREGNMTMRSFLRLLIILQVSDFSIMVQPRRKDHAAVWVGLDVSLDNDSELRFVPAVMAEGHEVVQRPPEETPTITLPAARMAEVASLAHSHLYQALATNIAASPRAVNLSNLESFDDD